MHEEEDRGEKDNLDARKEETGYAREKNYSNVVVCSSRLDMQRIQKESNALKVKEEEEKIGKREKKVGRKNRTRRSRPEVLVH